MYLKAEAIYIDLKIFIAIYSIDYYLDEN